MSKMYTCSRHGGDRVRLPIRIMTVLLTVSIGLVGWHRAIAADAVDSHRTPTIKEIGDGVKAQWDHIESLKVEYEWKIEAVAPHDIIKKYSLLGSLDGLQEAFAFKGKKRYYRYIQPPVSKVLAPDVEPEYDVIPGGKALKKQLDAMNARLGSPKLDASHYERGPVATKARPFEIGFDGKELHQRTPVGHASILDASTMGKTAQNFDQKYLENLDRVLPNPIGAPEDATRNCFPEVPLSGSFAVRPAPEDFDGARCVVVENRGRERIWFDPVRNFAVRKHEILAPDADFVAQRRINTDFTEVSRGIWLPKTCYREICGPPLSPEAYRGKPLYRDVLLVSRISVNDVPDSLFVVNIPPGDEVFDGTRATHEDAAHELVVYKMPADASLIDETVRNKLAEEADRRAQEKRKQYFWYGVLGVNLVIIAIIAIIFTRKSKTSD